MQEDLKYGKWVPVTERLPKYREKVLCQTEYGMVVGFCDNEWGQVEWTTGLFGGGTFNPTHWMPLPKPPKNHNQ